MVAERKYDKHNQSVMKPRFIWLLEALCKNSSVDTQLVDPKLTYSENKDNIEQITGVRLRLKGEAKLKGIFHGAVDMEEEDYAEAESMLDWYNSQVGVKKGRKKDKKVPVDIGNIIHASGVEVE